MRAIGIVTTVGNEEQAHLIARELVARRLAACVNILPGIRSVYRWKGKIWSDNEFMLVIKTQEAEFEAITAAIQELHSYELPEILAFNVSRGEDNFLAWITHCVDKSAGIGDGDEDDEDDEDELGYD